MQNVIDLTQTLKTGIPVYPDTQEAEFKILYTIENQGFQEIELKITSHTGTHLDCPAHLFQNALSVETMPIEHFFGKGLVINCLEIQFIDVQLLDKYKLDGVDFVLFYTAWDKYWGQQKYFHDFPVMTSQVAQMLIHKKIKGVGVDAISIDNVGDENLPIHNLLLANNIISIENLKNLDLLLDREFVFACFPLKLENGDGSPVRAVAIV